MRDARKRDTRALERGVRAELCGVLRMPPCLAPATLAWGEGVDRDRPHLLKVEASGFTCNGGFSAS